jgi:PASTA domain
VVDNEPVDDGPEPSEPASGPAPSAAEADVHGGGGGWRSWGHGVEGPLAIAALVVAVIALLVGTAGLIEARRADVKKSHPAPSSSSAGKITVPTVVGETGISASVKLSGNQLKSKTVQKSSATVEKGKVISQDPAAGAKVASGTVVTLTISDGPVSASGSPPPSSSGAPPSS